MPVMICSCDTKQCVTHAHALLMQLNTGKGKTRVILPMVAMEMCGQQEVVRLNFQSQLLPSAVHYLHACLTDTLHY